MKVLGYAAGSPAEALADPAGFFDDGLDLEPQRASLVRWARAEKHRLVRIVTERADAEDVPLREGLCDALEAVRDGEADGLVVTRLDRLAPEPILQEQLLGEIARIGARLLIVDPADARALTDPDPMRAAIRAAVAAVPVFQGDLRAMRARYRMVRARAGDEESKLIALERLEERGIAWRALRSRGRALG